MEKGWQRPRQVATLLYGKMFLAGLAPNAKHKTGLYHNKIILCFNPIISLMIKKRSYDFYFITPFL